MYISFILGHYWPPLYGFSSTDVGGPLMYDSFSTPTPVSGTVVGDVYFQAIVLNFRISCLLLSEPVLLYCILCTDILFQLSRQMHMHPWLVHYCTLHLYVGCCRASVADWWCFNSFRVCALEGLKAGFMCVHCTHVYVLHTSHVLCQHAIQVYIETCRPAEVVTGWLW